jgi:hypothetical protein
MTQTELKRQSGLLFEAVMRIAGDMTGMSIFVTAHSLLDSLYRMEAHSEPRR